MLTLHEVATITSKGQITLPKAIRNALGVGSGGSVAFDLQGTQIVVTRADSGFHEDPAIGSFLALLSSDIQNGRHISGLPEDLAQSMLASLQLGVELDLDIEGDVEL